MNRESAAVLLKRLDILKAFASGKQIQMKPEDGTWSSAHVVVLVGNSDGGLSIYGTYGLAKEKVEFRIKPQPVVYVALLFAGQSGNQAVVVVEYKNVQTSIDYHKSISYTLISRKEVVFDNEQ